MIQVNEVNVHTFAHIAAKALPIMEINVPIFDKHIWGKKEIIENEIKINTLFLYSMCEIIIMIFKVLQCRHVPIKKIIN